MHGVPDGLKTEDVVRGLFTIPQHMPYLPPRTPKLPS